MNILLIGIKKLNKIQNYDFTANYNKVHDAISKEYIPGSIEWIRENDPILAKEFDRTIKNLEETWNNALEGKASINDFENALRGCESINRKIKLRVQERNTLLY